jgi:hypothetical protein
MVRERGEESKIVREERLIKRGKEKERERYIV